jgi:hypothetical protein
VIEFEDKAVVVEIYTQVDPLVLEGDALVAVVKSKGAFPDRVDNLIPSLLRSRHGDHFHAQLKQAAAQSFDAGQTFMAFGDTMTERPPFKNVLFVSGKTPLSATLDYIFETADEFGCAEVVFPMEAIAENESDVRDGKYLNSILFEINLAIETLTLTSLRRVKVVLPGGIAE